jgi:ankyrin repeat/BTB/POZ domain-containing protein 2
MFEHAIANNGDLWGLLQPYAHLNAGRIASGECHWLAVGMLVSGSNSVGKRANNLELKLTQ